MMQTEWPTTWLSIRMTQTEYNRLADILLDISNNQLHPDDPYTLSADQAQFLGGWFHAYFAEGYFQGAEWKQRLVGDGHTVED